MSRMLHRFRHIAIDGPIGVGKSSLARKLAGRLGAELLLERPEDNPFLDRFYDDPCGYAFQAHFAFLFQRVRQMQSLAQPGILTGGVVSDFPFAKDALFARLNLADEEHRIYTRLREELASRLR